MKKVKYKITKLSCSNCVKTITGTLENYFGDDVKAKVNINNKKIYITYDENKVKESEIKQALKKSGYPVDEGNAVQKEKVELIISIVLTAPLLIAMIGHLVNSDSFIVNLFMNVYFQLVLATIIQFYIGRRFYISSYNGLKHGAFGMDFVVTLGSFSAYLYSLIMIILNPGDFHQELYFEVGGLIITIVLIGKYIESKMQSQTTGVIDALLDLNPKKARKIENGKEIGINYEDIKSGDILICYASDSIPADGEIIEGTTYIDESSFTGESKPVAKTVKDFVIGGSVNENSTIKIKVTTMGDKSVLNQIVSSIEDATMQDTKFQRIADKISGIFVPIVLIIALLTLLITHWVTGDWTNAITNALAVILISCPCALGLATPTSIMVSNQLASSNGLLYKSPKFFELADKINVVAFDKTGTITEGTPSVTDFYVEKDYIDVLYSLEKNSMHPISRQVVKYLDGKKSKDLKIVDFATIPGHGIKGYYNSKEVLVTNFSYIKENGIDFGRYYDEILQKFQDGKTLSVFVYDNRVSGYYTVEDAVKSIVIDVINSLKDLGIEPIMITGDNSFVADKVAKKAHIDKVYANVLPVQKAEILKEYQKKGKVVAMIGDGINDSVALKVADVGMSVKNASDIASFASDVVLMKNDLKLIVDGITISQRTNRNIKQNFMWAFSYNIIAIPFAATGNISMILATIAMSFSSIVVVLNSLRLKRDKVIRDL